LLGETVVTDRGVDAAWWGDAHDVIDMIIL
jgi:hypothetical protein